MRICHLDESEQQQDGVYYIGALVVTAEQIRSIDRDLDALHARLRETHPARSRPVLSSTVMPYSRERRAGRN